MYHQKGGKKNYNDYFNFHIEECLRVKRNEII